MSMLKEPESKAVAIVIFIALIAIVSYVTAAIKFDWYISVNPISWGPFGDYLGGILNPAIALAALFVLVKATKYQKSEFTATRNHLESEAKKNELYRVITHLDAKLESMLSVDVKENTGGGPLGIVTVGPLNHYLMPGWRARATLYVILGDSNLETRIASYLPRVREKIETLEKYVTQYEEMVIDEESSVVNYFRETYLPYKEACIEIEASFARKTANK